MRDMGPHNEPIVQLVQTAGQMPLVLVKTMTYNN